LFKVKLIFFTEFFVKFFCSQYLLIFSLILSVRTGHYQNHSALITIGGRTCQSWSN